MTNDHVNEEDCNCNCCQNHRLLEEESNNYHPKVYRPWGWYQNILEGENFKIKTLCINEGNRISLQKHHHRWEVWTIASGFGSVYCDETWHLAYPGNIFRINVDTWHRAKAMKGDLIIMELQQGKELYEEDIQRLEDDYGRTLLSS
tara:strand:+ start:355 stop:792 length:438 start_codon:yes stop_codon:yes gene_type:complete